MQDDPCTLYIAVDENGYSGGDEWNVTLGDWYTINVFNLDSEFSHTLRVESYGLTLTAEPIAEVTSAAFSFSQAGDFFVADNATGADAVIHVLEYDVVAYEEGSDDANQHTQRVPAPPDDESESANPTTGLGEDSPTLGIVFAISALGALAFAARRRGA